jgi:DNA polymerase-3 subunit delta
MALSTEQVLAQLKKGQYAPTYFLFGEEPFFIDTISDHVEQNALTAAEKGFNQTIVYGKDISLIPILESARRFPMGAKRQVIIIKEAQSLQELSKKEGQELLIKYAKNPTPTTILIFCYKHKKLNTQTKWFKELQQYATTVESKRFYNDKLPAWIKQYCKSLNYEIEEKAAFMMAEFIGNDLNRIANETDKMVVNFAVGSKLTAENVLKHIGISKEYNIFELQNALANKDVLKANKIINYFNANSKEHPLIPTVYMIYNFFTKLLLYQHNAGTDNDSLSRILKINKYFLREYGTASRNYSTGKVLNNLQYIHKADLNAKGVDSTVKDAEVLRELIFKLMH